MGMIPPLPVRIGRAEQPKESPKYQTDIFPEIEEKAEQSENEWYKGQGQSNRALIALMQSIDAEIAVPRSNPSIIIEDY